MPVEIDSQGQRQGREDDLGVVFEGGNDYKIKRNDDQQRIEDGKGISADEKWTSL
jgi:hypothetical protein